MVTAERYHDISCGHRVVGHESKCRHLHGHNYRIHFTVRKIDFDCPFDEIGRVLDFSMIKEHLCQWVENNWDHKTLIWEKDPKLDELVKLFPDSICVTTFNPTAENMAMYLVEELAPDLMEPLGCSLIMCRIEETRKCTASYYAKP